MRRLIVVAVLLGLGSWLGLSAIDSHASSAKKSDAEKIEALRRQGPAALQRLLTEYDRLNKPAPNGLAKITQARQTDLAELERTIDLVGGQKGCVRSRLFWFTDLEQAKVEATKTNKPILSLRLLGNLTDDLSCANSRFFRTTLYSNPELAQFLRDQFVLHWKPFAPVPRITIDFGDGRKIVRTITGNSIHYVLTSDGQVVDGLPGLYGPKEFQQQLSAAQAVAKEVGSQPAGSRFASLVTFHQQRLQELDKRWAEDRAKLERSETPIAATVTGKTLADLQREQHPDFWQQLAKLHRSDVQLDPSSVAAIQAMQPQAEAAGRLAMTKIVVERPALRMVRNLIDNIALDTVRNEYALHSQIHTWLSAVPVEMEAFNDRVYAELFLMPRSDPWLGLAPPDVFAALPNGGLVLPNTPPPQATVSQR